MNHRRLHLLLSVQSALIVLLSVNRLAGATDAFVAPNEFLRWVDLNNLGLGLAAVLTYFLVANHLQGNRRHTPLRIAFVIGAYLFAAGYGNHEVTNYLNARFCTTESDFCRVVAANDDGFSHLLFFAGFIILNVVIMLTQAVFPAEKPLTTWDNVVLVGNALFIAAGIFANLAFEKIGLDLYIVAVVTAVALVLVWRQSQQPIHRYYAVAFVTGLLGTVAAILV